MPAKCSLPLSKGRRPVQAPSTIYHPPQKKRRIKDSLKAIPQCRPKPHVLQKGVNGQVLTQRLEGDHLHVGRDLFPAIVLDVCARPRALLVLDLYRRARLLLHVRQARCLRVGPYHPDLRDGLRLWSHLADVRDLLQGHTYVGDLWRFLCHAWIMLSCLVLMCVYMCLCVSKKKRKRKQKLGVYK